MTEDAGADRVEIRVGDLASRAAYQLMTTCLIPRAIAWVSTRSATGVDNVAPHSFNTVAGVDPLTVCFVSVGFKDSLRNARETGEFVLHIGSEHHAAMINDSGTPLPAEHSEFDAAEIPREPSVDVAPPRIAGAPIAMECRVSGEYPIGDCVTVFGEVLRFAIDRRVMAPDGKPDPRLVAPVARLGRNQWSRLGEVFSLDRIARSDWEAGRRSNQPF